MLKEKEKNKFVTVYSCACIAFLVSAFIYNLVLPFCWGNNPFDTYGTISLLCEHRKPYFWAWAFLVGGGYFLNFRYMYSKFGYKSKLLDFSNIMMVLGVLGVALSLDHSIQTWNAKRIIHWATTILYIVFIGVSLLVFFIANIKRDKVFIKLTAVCAGIVLLLALWFLVLGRSGMMEIVPNALVMIFIFVINFTPAVKLGKKGVNQ